jgi:uncharacterized protein YaaR (DUF327 family)
MAKVDVSSFSVNPFIHGAVKPETKKAGDRVPVKKGGKLRFSSLVDEVREGDAADLGVLRDLPVSEETVNMLMEDVRSAGDALRGRPFPDEIVRYRKAVKNFMHYVVENGFRVREEAGIPLFLKPGFKGKRGTPESYKQVAYKTVEVVDRKLEEMAAMILRSQMPQLELMARLEEINGLLVDLLQ